MATGVCVGCLAKKNAAGWIWMCFFGAKTKVSPFHPKKSLVLLGAPKGHNEQRNQYSHHKILRQILRGKYSEVSDVAL